MSLAATIVITIAGSAKTFTRMGGDMAKSQYYWQDATVRYDLTFRQGYQTLTDSTGKKVKCRRGNVELQTTVFATASLGEIPKKDYVVSVKPINDYSTAEFVGMANALLASTNALFSQIVGGEV